MGHDVIRKAGHVDVVSYNTPLGLAIDLSGWISQEFSQVSLHGGLLPPLIATSNRRQVREAAPDLARPRPGEQDAGGSSFFLGRFLHVEKGRIVARPGHEEPGNPAQRCDVQFPDQGKKAHVLGGGSALSSRQATQQNPRRAWKLVQEGPESSQPETRNTAQRSQHDLLSSCAWSSWRRPCLDHTLHVRYGQYHE